MSERGLRLWGTQGDGNSKLSLYALHYGRVWIQRPPASPLASELSARLIGDGADNAPGKIAGPIGRVPGAGCADPDAFHSPKN